MKRNVARCKAHWSWYLSQNTWCFFKLQLLCYHFLSFHSLQFSLLSTPLPLFIPAPTHDLPYFQLLSDFQSCCPHSLTLWSKSFLFFTSHPVFPSFLALPLLPLLPLPHPLHHLQFSHFLSLRHHVSTSSTISIISTIIPSCLQKTLGCSSPHPSQTCWSTTQHAAIDWNGRRVTMRASKKDCL